MAYLRRALAEPCPEDQRAELLVELGEAEYVVDGRAALAHLQEALELTVDPRRYAQIAIRLGWLLTLSGRAEAAVATAELALARLADRDVDLRRSLQATILTAGYHDPSLVSYFPRKNSGGGVTTGLASRGSSIFTVGPISGTSASAPGIRLFPGEVVSVGLRARRGASAGGRV